MKIALVYFTGTGSTAKFAEYISEGFLELEHTVEFFRLKKGTKLDLSSFDIIGIGSPAYSFRIPWLASKLIRKTNFHSKPIFVFCTSGGMPGIALWNIYQAAKRTVEVCLGRIEGIGTTNIRSWMPKKSDEDIYLQGLRAEFNIKAKQYGKELIKRLDKWHENPTKKNKNKWKPFFSIQSFIWSLLFTHRWMMALTAGIKRVDIEKCTNCKLCATKICPSGAITLTSGDYPKFNEFICIGCNGCLNLCPEDAIWSIKSKKHVQYDLYADSILK